MQDHYCDSPINNSGEYRTEINKMTRNVTVAVGKPSGWALFGYLPPPLIPPQNAWDKRVRMNWSSCGFWPCVWRCARPRRVGPFKNDRTTDRMEWITRREWIIIIKKKQQRTGRKYHFIRFYIIYILLLSRLWTVLQLRLLAFMPYLRVDLCLSIAFMVRFNVYHSINWELGIENIELWYSLDLIYKN